MESTKTIKGIKWRNDSPIKGSLNEITESKNITFCEKQDDGTCDIVEVKLVLSENQYGEYSQEYLPNTLEKKSHKTVDITSMVIDEENKIGIWYILDAKDTISGDDRIFHLLEQWKCAYSYLKNTVLNYFNDVNFDENIGLVVRTFDEQVIINCISNKKQRLEAYNGNVIKSIVGVKKKQDNLKLLHEIKCLEDFIQGKFYYKDKIEGRYFNFVVLYEEKKNDKEYKTSVLIKIG